MKHSVESVAQASGVAAFASARQKRARWTGKITVPLLRKQSVPVLLCGAVLGAIAILESGCNRGQAADASAPPSSSISNPGPTNAVVLSSTQLNAIKIGTVGTFSFPVEKEEPGSVSFEEDPSEIQAESALLGAAATFILDSNQLARAKALFPSKGIAQSELDQDIANEQSAAAALKAARYAVLALGVTDHKIDQMIATGSMTGTDSSLGSSSDPPGRSVAAWVLADVAESDIPLLRIGEPVKVTVAAFSGRVFEGKICQIYAIVDPNVHRQAVRCEVNDPRRQLRVGMLATVLIEVSHPVEATAIPADGIVREGDGTMTAWVTTDHRHFTQRVIETGTRENGEVQILGGLRPGEQVVTDGAIFLDNMVNAVPSD